MKPLQYSVLHPFSFLLFFLRWTAVSQIFRKLKRLLDFLLIHDSKWEPAMVPIRSLCSLKFKALHGGWIKKKSLVPGWIKAKKWRERSSPRRRHTEQLSAEPRGEAPLLDWLLRSQKLLLCSCKVIRHLTCRVLIHYPTIKEGISQSTSNLSGVLLWFPGSTALNLK